MEFLTDLIEHREQIAAWLLTALVAATALVHVLQVGAHALEKYAEKSASKADDVPAKKLAAFADKAAGVLDAVTAWLPTIGRGVRR